MTDTPAKPTKPIERGFTYEVSLEVSIPLAWAKLLKQASKHHYDQLCREIGDQGVINGLYNTAIDGEWPSTSAVTWRKLDLITKVAEQLEWHTKDHLLIRTIRNWLHETKKAIVRQHEICDELPGSAAKEPA